MKKSLKKWFGMAIKSLLFYTKMLKIKKNDIKLAKK